MSTLGPPLTLDGHVDAREGEAAVKTCARCETELPATPEHFASYSRTSDGFQSWCRACVREYNREYNRQRREKRIPLAITFRRTCKWDDCARRFTTTVAHKRYCSYACGRSGWLAARPAAYGSWTGMLRRTTDPKHDSYRWYGGRGITVCERWRGEGGFESFLADMGERPEGMSLDRTDPDGNYEPENCCWATQAQQHQNHRLETRPG